MRDIHTWFSLSYGQYLTIPRSVLQSMPEEWQHKFVALLDELDETNWTEVLPKGADYKIELRKYDYNSKSEFVWREKLKDPLQDYQRGRRNIFKEFG